MNSINYSFLILNILDELPQINLALDLGYVILDKYFVFRAVLSAKLK